MHTSISLTSQTTALHVPIEICENIVDMMLDSRSFADEIESIAALHNCALVCRAWRIRAQRALFYAVHLSDLISLHNFSTALDSAQHLRSYVHEVVLTGFQLHTTASVLTVFLPVFAGKLPNLRLIDVSHLDESNKEYPRKPDPPAKAKILPYIPLHPYSRNFLSSFASVSVLLLNAITFNCFSDFVRMLHGLPALETLSCFSIRWITQGSTRFTMRPDWTTGRHTLPPFAPKLQRLRVRITTTMIL